MTNREALIAAVALPASPQEIEKALIDAALNEGSEYIRTNQSLLDNAAIEVLQGQKSTKSISEGGYTLTLDLNAINERIQYLARRAGRVDLLPVVSKPTISDASHLW